MQKLSQLPVKCLAFTVAGDVEVAKYKKFMKEYIVDAERMAEVIRNHLKSLIWFETKTFSFLNCGIRIQPKQATGKRKHKDSNVQEEVEVDAARCSTDINHLVWVDPEETIMDCVDQDTILLFGESIGLVDCIDRNRTYQLELRFRLVLQQIKYEARKSSDKRQKKEERDGAVSEIEDERKETEDDSDQDQKEIIYDLATVVWTVDDIHCRTCYKEGYKCKCALESQDQCHLAGFLQYRSDKLDFGIELEFDQYCYNTESGGNDPSFTNTDTVSLVDKNRRWTLRVVTLQYDKKQERVMSKKEEGEDQ